MIWLLRWAWETALELILRILPTDNGGGDYR